MIINMFFCFPMIPYIRIQKGYDKFALKSIFVCLLRFLHPILRIGGMDLNPAILYEKSFDVMDAMAILKIGVSCCAIFK